MNSVVCCIVSCALNAIWQVPLLTCAGWGASRLFSRWGPRPQHMVWVATLLLSSLTPALCAWHTPFPWISLTPGHSAVIRTSLQTGLIGNPAPASVLVLPPWLVWMACALYVSSVVYLLAKFLSSLAAVRALLRECAPARLAVDAQAAWERVRRTFAAGDAVLLWSASVRGIVTIGVSQPAIILPAAFEEWNADDFLSALGHELAHVERADYAKNLFYELAGVLTAFHPFTWMVKSQIRQTREMICDAIVAERVIDPKRYRRSLLRLAEQMAIPRQTQSHAVGMFDANILERRILMIKSKKSVPSRMVRAGLSLCATSLLIFAVIAGTAFARQVATPDQAGRADRVYHVGSGVTAPVLTYSLDPVYPRSADSKFDRHLCVIALIVNRDGLPEDVHVVRSAGRDFDANAIRAVRQYKFRPALLQGKPVRVAIKIEVNFRKY